MDDRIVSEVGVLEARGPAGLRVDDLTREDPSSLGWSGTPSHIVSVGQAFDRVESGEVEYLVARACAPSGHPVAKGGIDDAVSPGIGTLVQLATAEELQGFGVGAHLIALAGVPRLLLLGAVEQKATSLQRSGRSGLIIQRVRVFSLIRISQIGRIVFRAHPWTA